MKKKILVVCAMGMSTSLLVAKMQKEASEKGIEVEIEALPISEGIQKVQEFDIVLLGPQIRFQKNKIELAAAGKVPVQIIDMQLYGMIDGLAVLENALKTIREEQ